jgi:hypothetical protein
MPLTKEEYAEWDRLYEQGLKICSRCKQILPLEDFAPRARQRHGLSSTCIKCKKEYHSEYQKTHRDQENEKVRRYRVRNKERLSKKDKETKHELNKRYSSYKTTAKAKNLPFKLSKDDFKRITSMPCFYCGDITEDEYSYSFVGIDRIDHTKGYELDNIVPCCKSCNWMKSDFSVKDWVLQMQKITNKQKSKTNLETEGI